MTRNSRNAAQPLSPRRAVLHPAFLGSLAVLALNDHVFKGANIFPEFVTGKLSDVAGMLVAPLLLAAVVGVRTRRAWWAAHVAVAAVFSAIQVSTTAAAAWAGAMSAVGFPWVITADPTDLAALPLLLLSAALYPAAMRAAPRQNLRSSAEVGIAGVGVAVCAATSPPPPDLVEPDLFTDVWLHNATDASVVVRVRGLAPSVDADCDVLATDPGRLLSEPLFGDARAWTLAPDENLSVRAGIADEWEEPTRDCMVGLVQVDGVAPAIFFWRDEDLDSNTVPAQGWHDDISGGVMIETEADGQSRFTHDDEDMVDTLVTALPPTTGACAPQSEGARVAWGEVPSGLHRLAGFDPGVDGCIRLDLVFPGADIETTASEPWYLCVPTEVFPFAAGDEISIEAINTGASDGIRVAAQGPSLAELWVYAGGLAPSTKGVSFAPVPDYGCEFRADPKCGTISRSSVIVAGGGNYEAIEVAAGQAPVTLSGNDGGSAVVYVAHAQERVALDVECAEGPDTLGDDVELAVAIIPAAQ